jgi:hypothetical protein
LARSSTTSFVEFFFVYIFIISSSLAFIGEHGKVIFIETSEKHKFSKEFKIALQWLALAASAIVIFVSYQGLVSLPDPNRINHAVHGN